MGTDAPSPAEAAAVEAKRLRRHWVISGIATVCVLLGGTAHQIVTAEEPVGCTIDHNAFLVGVWDAPTRTQIEQRIAAGSPGSLSGDIVEIVDAQADAWMIVASSTCDLLAKAEGNAALIVQRHCLVARLRQLSVVVGELQTQDDPQAWVDAVDSLESIEDCESPVTAAPVVNRMREAEAKSG